MLTIACVKWGNWCAPHGARYVNNLYRSVTANLTLPHRFVCFADNTEGLDAGIETHALPDNLAGYYWETLYPSVKRRKLRPLLAVPYRLLRDKDNRQGIQSDKFATPYPIDLRGWYNKLYLFRPGVLEGRCIFIDLDTVITGNLDELFDYDGDFCLLRDFHHPYNYGSGLMAFRAEATTRIWTEYIRLGCPVMPKGDQQFIEKIMPDADFFQDRLPGQVVSYKLNCRRRGVPSYARIVCFHGNPRPHEMSDDWCRVYFDVPARSLERVPGPKQLSS
jgi:hypothetical protein